MLALVVAHGSKFKGPCLVILYGTGTRVIDRLWLLNNIKSRTPNRADGTLVTWSNLIGVGFVRIKYLRRCTVGSRFPDLIHNGKIISSSQRAVEMDD